MIGELTTLYYMLKVKNLNNISLKRLTRWMRMKKLCGRRLMLSYVVSLSLLFIMYVLMYCVSRFGVRIKTLCR